MLENDMQTEVNITFDPPFLVNPHDYNLSIT